MRADRQAQTDGQTDRQTDILVTILRAQLQGTQYLARAVPISMQRIFARRLQVFYFISVYFTCDSDFTYGLQIVIEADVELVSVVCPRAKLEVDQLTDKAKAPSSNQH